LAAEWREQRDFVDFMVMPATRLANTALDAVASGHAQTAEQVAAYAAADLLCYFAEAPASLVRRQNDLWGPLLEWADRVAGLKFLPSSGIVHRDQPPATLVRVEEIARKADDFALAGLAFGTALYGSAIVTLALWLGRIDSTAAFAAARLDHTFQEERWGVDSEAAKAAESMERESTMLGRWFSALGGGELVTSASRS
jgi:chaperone required for assembly of F1-ATPase